MKSEDGISVSSAKFYIGGKELNGKVVRLPKPLLVCACTDAGGLERPDTKSESPVLNLFSVIREKVVFDTRPTIEWK